MQTVLRLLSTTRCHSTQPAARDLGYVKGSLPIAEKLSDQILSLPIFPGMTDEQQEIVAAQIRAFYGNPLRG